MICPLMSKAVNEPGDPSLNVINCQADRCQLWDEAQGNCSQAAGTAEIAAELSNLVATLDQLISKK